MTRDDPGWTLRYADGAANAYEVVGAGADVDVAYVPVTPRDSSSGTYSGGAPWRVRIDASDPRIEELWRRVDALASVASSGDGGRAMGTGAFTVTRDGTTRTFVVAPGPGLDAFDALIRGLAR
ncbi:MAG: hypothetical protein H6709_13415 [Kofleriaceae bacterium]|nr:hypothetical protein [Myxococcales bacterium]MCB9564418.1 hypothetical protein [Kofleriaceae bacterium]MCB9573077.1 hypothetical protein [Kofleriaceae bacterium]